MLGKVEWDRFRHHFNRIDESIERLKKELLVKKEAKEKSDGMEGVDQGELGDVKESRGEDEV